MRHAVSYSSFSCTSSPAFPSGYVAKRPILRLTLIANGRHFNCFADVDSGADKCAFPVSFASQLGLNVLANPRVSFTSGVGSSQVPIHYWNIRMLIPFLSPPQPGAQPTITTLSIDADVGFTTGLEAQGMGLLGQDGFFDRVIVVFDHAHGLFHVETPDVPSQQTPHP